MFKVKYKSLIVFHPPEPQPNSLSSAQWHFRQASHIANGHVGRSLSRNPDLSIVDIPRFYFKPSHVCLVIGYFTIIINRDIEKVD